MAGQANACGAWSSILPNGASRAQVSVRILGGLMALGYEIGTIMKRTSIVYADSRLTIKLDTIDGMGQQFVQVLCALHC